MISRALWTRTVPVRGLRRVRLLDAVVVVTVVVVLAVLSLVSGLRADDTPGPSRAELSRTAQQVAEAEVLGLVTLDRKSIEASVPDLRARAAASYRRDLGRLLDQLSRAALDYDGLTEGRIVSSDVVAVGRARAQVEVTAATTTTRRRTEPVDRAWRWAVSLRRSGGEWLVTALTQQPPEA